jgi:hypothetical protein
MGTVAFSSKKIARVPSLLIATVRSNRPSIHATDFGAMQLECEAKGRATMAAGMAGSFVCCRDYSHSANPNAPAGSQRV